MSCSNDNLERRVTPDPGPQYPPKTTAQIHESRGVDELVLGHYEAALAHLLEAARIYPQIEGEHQHQTRLAICYNEMGRPDDAVAAAERALALLSRDYVLLTPAAKPYRASALSEAAQGHLARYDLSQNPLDLSKATAYIQEARDLAPDSPQLQDLCDEILSRQAR